jgi:hypothetical protein
MPNDDVIDINDPALQQEMIEADPEADYFALPPPPPDDRDYQVKIMLGSNGLVAKRQQRTEDHNGARTGALFLSAALDLTIIDPGQPWDGARVFDNPNSIIMQRSGTSLLHAILKAVGAPALGRMPLLGPGSLYEHTLGVIASEPVCMISGHWLAQVEDPTALTNKDRWRTVRKGMQNFPLLDPAHPELGHSPYVPVIDPVTKKETGEEIRAKFKVTSYFRG